MLFHLRHKIDNAVRDHAISNPVRKRDLRDRRFHKVNILNSCLPHIRVGFCEHLVVSVNADRMACRPDLACGEEDVEPCAGAEVDNCFALENPLTIGRYSNLIHIRLADLL